MNKAFALLAVILIVALTLLAFKFLSPELPPDQTKQSYLTIGIRNATHISN